MLNNDTISGFRALNVPAALCEMLKRNGITEPTPIQAQAIMPAMAGHDIIGIAQTGTGKTLAFGLPMAANLRHDQVGLILAPTRELAMQIQDTFRSLKMRTALLIGGAPMGGQMRDLRSRPQVIIATPGRLMDHLTQGTMLTRDIKILVLDEADRMLDMGFAPTIKKIEARLPRARQTMMFSATMPREIEDLMNQYLLDPIRVEVERAGTVADKVDQELIVVQKEEKGDMLKDLLYTHKGTVLVFARTRHGARKLAKSIRILGHTADEIHSDRTLAQRKNALEGFKAGKHRILVATDIAARGIDVKNISLVINYDLPDNAEDYIHRIGRTGRAGATGLAITLAAPDQAKDVRDIEKLMKFEFPISELSTNTLPRPVQRQQGAPSANRNRRPSNFGRGPSASNPRSFATRR